MANIFRLFAYIQRFPCPWPRRLLTLPLRNASSSGGSSVGLGAARTGCAGLERPMRLCRRRMLLAGGLCTSRLNMLRTDVTARSSVETGDDGSEPDSWARVGGGGKGCGEKHGSGETLLPPLDRHGAER